MIHVIVGGSMSGKSTYVMHHYLMVAPVQFSAYGLILTGEDGTVAIGPYAERQRGQGIDAVSHTRGWMHTVLSAVRELSSIYDIVVVEGNNIQSETFFDALEKMKPVKLIMLDPPIETIRERHKKLNEPWNVNVAATYERALRIFEKYKGVFPHEIHR